MFRELVKISKENLFCSRVALLMNEYLQKDRKLLRNIAQIIQHVFADKSYHQQNNSIWSTRIRYHSYKGYIRPSHVNIIGDQCSLITSYCTINTTAVWNFSTPTTNNIHYTCWCFGGNWPGGYWLINTVSTIILIRLFHLCYVYKCIVCVLSHWFAQTDNSCLHFVG